MEEIIKVENLCFEYEPGLQTISNISFQIHKGEYVAILGHNGSGKSTIAKLLIGLLEKKSGEIYIDDYQLNLENLYKIREKVGIVFQNPDNQFVGATVEDDVAFGMENQGIARDEMKRRVDEALLAVNMQAFKSKEPARLSGGQKQRVAIARAIIKNPKILLFDDCLSAVDTETEEKILNNLLEISKDKTTIIVSHRVSSAKNADKIIILEQGKIIQQGSHNQLVNQEGYYKELYYKQLSEKEV